MPLSTIFQLYREFSCLSGYNNQKNAKEQQLSCEHNVNLCGYDHMAVTRTVHVHYR
jgi:hypothetical protein